MRSAGSTKSTSPVAMALSGMPGKRAFALSCTTATPPAALIARRPAVPSLPVPDRTMQKA